MKTFSIRAALMGTASPIALWSDIEPAPATVDNLSFSAPPVRRERASELRGKTR